MGAAAPPGSRWEPMDLGCSRIGELQAVFANEWSTLFLEVCGSAPPHFGNESSHSLLRQDQMLTYNSKRKISLF